MEEILFIILVALLILFIGPYIYCARLSSRISNLERLLEGRNKEKRTETKETQTHKAAPKAAETQKHDTPDLASAAYKQIRHKAETTRAHKETSYTPEYLDRGESIETKFFNWLKADWPMKVGAFLLLLGFAWLARYAFLKNWIGPMDRIILGFVGSAIIFYIGEWRIKKFKMQGAILVALGAGAAILTMFAARFVYDFFTPVIALSVMFLIVVATAISSVRHKEQSLSILGLLIGAIAPLLINAPDLSVTEIMSYITLLSAGFLWLVSITKWQVLSTIALITAMLYSAPFLVGGIPGNHLNAVIFFSSLLAIIFYVSNLFSIHRKKKANLQDLTIAGLNAILYIGWINSIFPEAWQSVTCVIAAVIFILGAKILEKICASKDPVFLYSGIAMIFVAAATAFELDGAALTIAYTLEATLITLGASVILKNNKIANIASCSMIIPIIMSFESIGSKVWQKEIIHQEFFVILTLTLCLSGLGIYFLTQKRKGLSAYDLSSLIGQFFVVGGTYVAILTWLILEPRFGIPAVTIAYTFEILVTIVLTSHITKNPLTTTLVSYLLVIPIILSFDSIDSGAWNKGILHYDFFALLTLSIIPFVIAEIFQNQKHAHLPNSLSNNLLIMGALYCATTVWLSLEALIPNEDTAHMIALIIYTLVGLYFYLAGKIQDEHKEYIIGSIILAAVSLRLLFVEVWMMSLTGRIITFFLIGTLLISSAFIGNKKDSH